MRTRPTITFDSQDDILEVSHNFFKEIVNQQTGIQDINQAMKDGLINITFLEDNHYQIFHKTKDIGKIRLNLINKTITYYKP